MTRGPANSGPAPAVSFLLWGDDVVEDWLRPLGVTLETFATEMSSSSWIFGYAAALRAAGVPIVLVCVTSAVSRPQRREHVGLGAPMYVLPAPRVSRWVRRHMLEEHLGARRDPRSVARAVLRNVASYLATPPRALMRVLREENCAALLVQEYEYARFDTCVALGKLTRLPVFATFQGGSVTWTRIERHIRPHTMRACDGLIVGSRAEADRIVERYRVAPARLGHIPNPIDVDVWRPADRAAARSVLGIAPDARVVVWHGRVYVHAKGLDVLLDAWQRITSEREAADLELLLIGTGPDAGVLREAIAAQQARGVRWIDEFVLDGDVLRSHLSAGDVYTLPSRREGFPIAPLEAMACGLPIVAADVPGVRDILADGEASGGIVVAAEDAAALATALGRLIDDAELSRRLGTRARARIEDAFSLGAIGAQLRAFFSAHGASLD